MSGTGCLTYGLLCSLVGGGSQDVQPQAGTESCQSHHIQYILSGRLTIAMDNGVKTELEPGDFVFIPPGHDAWVVGDEPFVAVDFAGLREYVRES